MADQSIRTLLVSLGVLTTGVVGCSSSSSTAADAGVVLDASSIGCGNALPCAAGCPTPTGLHCGDGGLILGDEDAAPDAGAHDAETDAGPTFGCGNAPVCAPGCTVPPGVICEDGGSVDAGPADAAGD